MDTIFKDFLTEISPALQTLIATLVTVLLGQLSAYLNKQYQVIKSRASSEQQYFLDFIVRRAVDTVEQLYKSEPNTVKLDRAVAIVENVLSQYGIVLDGDVIVDAIEAQVFQSKGFSKYVSESKG